MGNSIFSFLVSKSLKQKRKNNVPRNKFPMWLPALELHVLRAEGAMVEKHPDKNAVCLSISFFTSIYWEIIKSRKRSKGANFRAKGLTPSIKKKRDAINASKLPQ